MGQLYAYNHRDVFALWKPRWRSQQPALANAQELINKMNDKCFVRCITKPGTSLTPNDEACLMRCTDRFLEAFNLISAKYVQRVQAERESAAAGGNLLPQ